MSKETSFRFTLDVLLYPIIFVMAIWLVYWVEVRFKVNFNSYGVNPSSLKGLRGIIFSPFIHSGIKHLFNNSIPLLVLTMALFYFYRNITWRVLFFGILLTGLLTWIIGREANHIGASGMIYMLVSFLFFKGIFSKHYRLIALSLAVVFLYGGLWWYVMPIDPGISWEGHLAGFITGILFAFVFRSTYVKTKRFKWEQESYNPQEDPFMQAFDEDGNFIGTPKPISEENAENAKTAERPNVKITYIYRSSEDTQKHSTD